MISWILVPGLWAALVIFGNGNGSMRTKGPVLNRLNHPCFHGWIAPSWLRWGSNRSDKRLDFDVLFIFVRSQDHFAVHVQSSNVAISSSHFFGMKPPEASLGGFYSDGHLLFEIMGDHRPPLPVNRVTSPLSYRWTPCHGSSEILAVITASPSRRKEPQRGIAKRWWFFGENTWEVTKNGGLLQQDGDAPLSKDGFMGIDILIAPTWSGQGYTMVHPKGWFTAAATLLIQPYLGSIIHMYHMFVDQLPFLTLFLSPFCCRNHNKSLSLWTIFPTPGSSLCQAASEHRLRDVQGIRTEITGMQSMAAEG